MLLPGTKAAAQGLARRAGIRIVASKRLTKKKEYNFKNFKNFNSFLFVLFIHLSSYYFSVFSVTYVLILFI